MSANKDDNTPPTHAVTRIAGTYISLSSFKFADFVPKGVCLNYTCVICSFLLYSDFLKGLTIKKTHL